MTLLPLSAIVWGLSPLAITSGVRWPSPVEGNPPEKAGELRATSGQLATLEGGLRAGPHSTCTDGALRVTSVTHGAPPPTAQQAGTA